MKEATEREIIGEEKTKVSEKEVEAQTVETTKQHNLLISPSNGNICYLKQNKEELFKNNKTAANKTSKT